MTPPENPFDALLRKKYLRPFCLLVPDFLRLGRRRDVAVSETLEGYDVIRVSQVLGLFSSPASSSATFPSKAFIITDCLGARNP